MNSSKSMRNRPLTRFVFLAVAFAAGMMVERSGRWLDPYSYTPAGLEKTFAPFWETWDFVDRYYVDRSVVEPQRLTRAAIDGMLGSLGDPGHTSLLSPEEVQKMESALEGHMEGIGVRMAMRQKRPTITMTVPGSPARSAGLKAGDVILQVDGKSVARLTIDQIAALVRGPLGEKVQLQVGREGQSKPLEVAMARARVEVPDVTWRMLPGTKIVHLAIHSFGKQAHEQLKAALETARNEGAVAFVIDVRGNQGGIKDQAVQITSEFLTEGNVLIEQDAQGNQTAVPVVAGGQATDLPLCVLIDCGSASSAEIFAGAIQDHGRGKLIGTQTFGAGTVLNVFSLSDGSALKLAVSEWLTPNGRRIWHEGISPDIRVALTDPSDILQPEMEEDLTSAGLAKIADKPLQTAINMLAPPKQDPAH
jgi:carboxyl-terminal processing protease